MVLLSLSFAPPKESNQRKRVRKRQPLPVCPHATQGQNGATKQGAVRTFSGLPALYGFCYAYRKQAFDVSPAKKESRCCGVSYDLRREGITLPFTRDRDPRPGVPAEYMNTWTPSMRFCLM
jgi:hypothetical protein